MSSTREGVIRPREYPSAPVVGVAGVVLHGESVLLIQRGREPMLGRWTLPGGALELGETMAAGVAREVREETGMCVTPLEVIATLDRIVRDASGAVQYHYVLVDWLCVIEGGLGTGNPVCGDDAACARWVNRQDLQSESYSLDPITLDVINRAVSRSGAMAR